MTLKSQTSGESRAAIMRKSSKTSAAFRAMIRRSKLRFERAAALIDAALALPLPRLVLVKGTRKILLSRNSYADGLPYRITFFDERGPSNHLEFRASDRSGSWSMDSEIASALYNRYRLEGRAR